MSPREAPTRTEALLAYALSALTTLLWVACVLPAGSTVGTPVTSDDAVPLHRAALLLVPALLLLIATPVGLTLARRERGMRAVLATTDAFVALYVAAGLWSVGGIDDLPSAVALLLLVVVGGLSLLETWRATRAAPDRREPPALLSGARLAICLLVLVAPLYVLNQADVERASLLAPFFFVAVGAAGARLARGMRGLHRTGALVQLLLAVHIFITLRYTMFATHPELAEVFPAGRVTMGLAFGIVGVAALQLVVYFRSHPQPKQAPADAPAAPAA